MNKNYYQESKPENPLELKLGTWQELKILSLESIGAYLCLPDAEEKGRSGHSSQDKVLLPGKQLPSGAKAGDQLRVFLYKDSQDRLIATVHEPKIVKGEVAVLKVKQVAGIGAFLDWGLEKDLLLPFKEQTEKVREGMYYPVALYVDKSGRLAATMWIDKYIRVPDPDEKKKQKSLLQLRADAENVYVLIRRKGGMLDYNDRADAEIIKRDFGLSKNAFKRAVGVLYKERRLMIHEDSIELL